MGFINKHLVKRVFKFEEPSYLSDMAKNEDYSVSYDLTSCIITSVFMQALLDLLVSSLKEKTTNVIASRLAHTPRHG